MKKIAIALLTTALASNAALANKFCGPYIGVGLGYGHTTGKSNMDVQDNVAPLTFTTRVNGDRSANGVLGGLHVGWDKVWHDKWLLGLEGTGDLSSIDGTSRDQHGAPADQFNTRSKVQMKYAFGVNLRAGVVMHDVLSYLSLGWLGAQFEQDISYINTAVGFPTNTFKRKKKEFLNGWRAGLGMGTMLNEHLMLSGEVAHTWFEKINLRQNVARFDNGGVTNLTATSNYHPRPLEGRIKLSWKFRAPR